MQCLLPLAKDCDFLRALLSPEVIDEMTYPGQPYIMLLLWFILISFSSLSHCAVWRRGNEALEFIDSDNNMIEPRYSTEFVLFCLSTEMTPTFMVHNGQFVRRGQLLVVFSHKINPRILEVQKYKAPASGTVEIIGVQCDAENTPIIVLRHVPKSGNKTLVNIVNTAIEYFIYSSL